MIIQGCLGKMLIHKTRKRQSCAYLGLAIWLLATPAMAMPTVPQDFFATDNAAEIFFKAGRKQLDSEIKRLHRQPLKESETSLQIDEQTQLNEEELENGDSLPFRRQRSNYKGT